MSSSFILRFLMWERIMPSKAVKAPYPILDIDFSGGSNGSTGKWHHKPPPVKIPGGMQARTTRCQTQDWMKDE